VDLVTRTRFSQAGVDGLVNLAYGQSTLFIDFLAQRHGTAALARFLTTLGQGTAATPAFAAAFGAFGPESAAYEGSLTQLKTDLQPGLYVMQRAIADRPVVLALVGGPVLDTAVVEVLKGGELSRRRELDLDGAGLLVVSLPAAWLDGPDGSAPVRLRVTVPRFGALEIDPVAGTSASPASAPSPAPSPMPRPSPVQVPAQVPAA
jgi:hypothetical protein